ncbi:MAG: hypothetical protein A2Y74_09955 [Actinobacteria bacterium RBG_13_63_9]|nr:MAG: hypothetical protein A2Y74_09955 [Actinobacteria bacterium RBG_13_63_9]
MIEPYHVESTCPAGAAEDTSVTVRRDGRIAGKIRVFFPPGPEGTLQISLAVTGSDGSSRNLITFPGANYITGDSTTLEYECTAPLWANEVIVVSANNTDGVNDHAYAVIFSIDYGG